MKEKSNNLLLDLFSGNGRLSEENRAIVKKEFSKYIEETDKQFFKNSPFDDRLSRTIIDEMGVRRRRIAPEHKEWYKRTKIVVENNDAIKQAIGLISKHGFSDKQSLADLVKQKLNELNECGELTDVLEEAVSECLEATGSELADWGALVLKAIYALIKALPELKEKIEQWRKYREVKRAYKKLQKKGLPNLGTNDPLQDGHNPNIDN